MGILIGIGQQDPSFAYNYYYGVEFDSSVAATTGTRLGLDTLHASVPIQSNMKRCILKDDGTVNYYLGANDSTKTAAGGTADLSGAAGQVMVEIPAHYRRFETEGTKQRCYLSEYALPGFELVPKCYVSAYEATVDRTNSKLASVVNLTAQYRGGSNNSSRDEQDNTDLGKPATSISLTNFRTYARNRGASGEHKWNCYTYDVHKTLTWLFMVEYNNRNSQDTYHADLDANGYHYGGLGDGVTTLSGGDWNTFNGYNPVIPCGTTNSLGNKTGVVTYNLPASYGSGSVSVSVPSYRGVENPWGHIWKWTDGCLFSIDADTVSKAYTCPNPGDYSSSLDTTKYVYKTDVARTEGYVKTIGFGEEGDIFPTAVGGSSSTYFCDYWYTDIPSSGTATRGLLVGGDAYYGATCGFACLNSYLAPSYTSANFGSRLCFIPEAA